MRGKQVLVTGGGRGIGKAIVKGLAADGYDIWFSYRSDPDGAKALLAQLKSSWPAQSFTATQTDLSCRAEIDKLAGRIADADHIYGFIHNAGMSYDSLAAAIDQDRASALMQVNFWSMTRLIKAVIRPMMGAKSGRIIGIGSVTALQATPGNASYAASKGAMLSYIKTLAIELAKKNITANYIAPGYVDTDLLKPYAKQRSGIEKLIPARRFAKPAEIAALTSYLLSPGASYMTGAVLPIDGGLSAAAAIRG